MKVTDDRILEFIKKSHTEEGFDLEKFLNPSECDFRDVKKFKNIDKIVEKINGAISAKKRILVYGDYDCDGICASTILYLYLHSIGADVNVFIPNRFENGYGISVDAIDEIISDYAPELIITVDLGITAVEEVEILKEEGIDIVITDHHLPLAEVPDCLILDPKSDNAEYGFDGLCGTGVAMKLVEALSGRGEANRYLDLCAIATIGDIVPLKDENRAIARLGIDKINNGQCLKSLTFLKNKLELQDLSSSDISFKIVPRLNACGRMDNAIKVFDFLIEEDDELLEQKYNEMESDNNLRLACIDKGNKEIDKVLAKFDADRKLIMVQGDFHEGVIGILASRVCHEYNKPTIIFTKTENGTLKGSGRSIEAVDLHENISKLSGMLENFGGHKMAVGVEILPENFDAFYEKLNELIESQTKPSDYLISDNLFDIEITDDDFSFSFLNQLSALEPFGCENEKPVLAIKQKDMVVHPISEKSFKHFKAFTKKNNPIISFYGYNYVDVLKNDSEKYITIDLLINSYKGKSNINAYAKNVFYKKASLNADDDAFVQALYNKYCSIFDFNNMEKYHEVSCSELEQLVQNKFKENEFGTLVVAVTHQDLELIEKLNLQKYYSPKALKNGQNAILVNSQGLTSLDEVQGYKNIIFLTKYFDEEHLYFSQKHEVFEPKEKLQADVILSKDRADFVKCYKLISNFAGLKANNIFELAKKLAIKESSLNSNQILFAIIVFMELNFIEFDEVLNQIVICKAKKMDLASSKFLNQVGE